MTLTTAPNTDVLREVSRRRHRRATKNRRIGALVTSGILTIVAIAGVLAWPHAPKATGSTEASLTLSAHLPTGPVHIKSVDTTLWWSTVGQAHATIWLENSSNSEVTARTWWIVGRTGDPKPWTDAVLMSPVHAVKLAPHANAQVLVSSAALPPQGTYTLSFWAHAQNDLDPRGFVPSDGTALVSSLVVQPIGTSLVHVGGSQIGLLVSDVSVQARDSRLIARVKVANVDTRPNTAVVTVVSDGVTATAQAVVGQVSTATFDVPIGAADASGKAVRVSVGTLRPGSSPDERDVVVLDRDQ